MIKRLSTEKQREEIKEQQEFKEKDEKNLTDKEIRKLVILIAKKLNIL